MLVFDATTPEEMKQELIEYLNFRIMHQALSISPTTTKREQRDRACGKAALEMIRKDIEDSAFQKDLK